MEVSISKIDAATDQLNWAIRLFLDNRAYLPAITLAGAAEEILGVMLGDKSAFSQIKTDLVNLSGMNAKIVSQRHLNRARNWLKHWKDLKDPETISIDLESEAIQYIVRALTNLAAHDGCQPSEGQRFSSWIDVNRPDLMEDETE